MRKFFVKGFSVLIALSMLVTCAVACTDSGGDGKKSCKNCGAKSVYSLGFCKRCYDSFCDYTYG